MEEERVAETADAVHAAGVTDKTEDARKEEMEGGRLRYGRRSHLKSWLIQSATIEAAWSVFPALLGRVSELEPLAPAFFVGAEARIDERLKREPE